MDKVIDEIHRASVKNAEKRALNIILLKRRISCGLMALRARMGLRILQKIS